MVDLASMTQLEVTSENFQKVYKDNIKQIEELLNSSEGKNIVAFVGLTGSGKSTLINYLCQKELIVDEYENIVLKIPNDLNAMQIGITNVSETSLPKFFKYDDFLLYDLPGFGDSRGTIVNIINSSIIKNIIENAKTAIIVFVISENEIIAGRGKLFKELLFYLKTLIPNVSLQENSALVVTKSTPGIGIEDLVRKLKQKSDGDTIMKWHSSGRLAKMELAHENTITDTDRKQILDAVFKVAQKRINYVNISTIYDNSSSSVLKKICKEEIQKIFENHLSNILDSKLINSLSIAVFEDKLNQLYKYLEECNFDSSPLIVLLKSISMEIFDYALIKLKNEMKRQVDSIILQCSSQIKQQMTKNRSLIPLVCDLGFTVVGISLTLLIRKVIFK